MRAILQWESIKTLLKAQYGVPDGITDQLDNIMRLQYQDAWSDYEANEKEQKDDLDDEEL